MNAAIASILQESNTFSPVATRYEDFDPVFGQDAFRRHDGKLTEMGGFIDILRPAGTTIRPVCAAWAITANRLKRADFDRLAGEFEAHLRRAKPDALLLAMHGAPTAEGEDDVESHILERVRAVLGDGAPIVLTLDLHANVTRRMVTLANAIVGYRTYPHVDMFETGQKAARLLLRILRGDVQPRMAFRKLPLIVQAEKSQTYSGPMRKLIATARKWEENGQAEAVSIFPVVTEEEKAAIASQTIAAVRGPVPWRELLRTRRLWCLLFAAFGATFMWQFYIIWFPTYLREQRGMSLTESSYYASLPLLLGAGANWLGGVLTDWIGRRSDDRTARTVVGFCSMFAGALLMPAGAVDLYLGAAWSSATDIGGTSGGAVAGLMNAASNCAGFASPALMGYVLRRSNNWNAVLYLSVATTLCAAIAWLFVNPRRATVATASSCTPS